MQNQMTPYEQFIYTRTYARWNEAKKRREVWDETVDRYRDFFIRYVPDGTKPEFEEAITAIRNREVMPSMRALWSAGPSLEKESIAGYNCSYMVMSSPKAFAELLYILMNGTGVGYSVERQYISELPEVPTLIENESDVIEFKDSKLGWAEGYYKFIMSLYSGVIPKFDLSKIRPKGSILRTTGGRASGPEPLLELLEFTKHVFLGAQARKLNSLEVHDICCMIANTIIVGGVRRSACLSLSNRTDDRMAHAKDGEFWHTAPHRSLANNSISYTDVPSAAEFLADWLTIVRSGSGERGIFNRKACQFIAAQSGRRDANHEFGCNPCLHPDALVNTLFGVKRIKDIKSSTYVYTMLGDGTLGVAECSPAFKTKKNARTIVVELSTGKKITCTPDHLICKGDMTWEEAGKLVLGDKVCAFNADLDSGIDKKWVTVSSITPGPTSDVYDLFVAATHNFMCEGIVVHNCSN